MATTNREIVQKKIADASNKIIEYRSFINEAWSISSNGSIEDMAVAELDTVTDNIATINQAWEYFNKNELDNALSLAKSAERASSISALKVWDALANKCKENIRITLSKRKFADMSKAIKLRDKANREFHTASSLFEKDDPRGIEKYQTAVKQYKEAESASQYSILGAKGPHLYNLASIIISLLALIISIGGILLIVWGYI